MCRLCVLIVVVLCYCYSEVLLCVMSLCGVACYGASVLFLMCVLILVLRGFPDLRSELC